MRLVPAALVVVLLAAALAAQTPARPQQPTFKAGVNLVRVDVYVTANGRAVPDLNEADFEVREDGVPQRIETFEQVVAASSTSEVDRDEPANVDESNEAAGNARNRLFVLFWDTMHTLGYATPQELAGEPLQPFPYDPRMTGRAFSAFFHRLIGPDDLLALMTPETAVTALTFTRRASALDDFLLTGGRWNMHAQRRFVDEAEQEFMNCGPRLGAILIGLRRRNLALGALEGLITHLQGLREGRKVVFVVSEGFGVSASRALPMDGLGRARMQRPPGIGGLPGQPPFRRPDTPGDFMEACRREVAAAARVDVRQQFLELLREAKRTNVVFYPFDPRGLTVERLNQDSLLDLAAATDGRAIVTLNDPTAALKRVADEASSYYLLGYYSTNSKTDGKFRTITVRVRRQGAQVLARPGYYALSDAEIAARARADAPLDPEVARLNKLLSTLGTERPDVPLRIAAGCCFESSASDGAPRLALWVTAELDAATARTMAWSSGADAEVTMTPADSTRPLAVQHSSIEPAVPRFDVRFRDLHLLPGDYRVKVQLSRRSGDTGGEIAQVRVRVPDVSATGASVLGEPMLSRRGPYTSRHFHPTADRRFRRTEGIRVDVPLAASVDLVTTQLLDRHGKPLRLELTAGQREDGGQRFATTEIALASFAPGDFLVEVTVHRGQQTEKAVTAFRIVP